jgi:preprotein translocase SecE subunit
MSILAEKKSGIIDNININNNTKETKVKPKEKVRKSFIKSYIEELKDVDWPTKKQSIIWFFTTIAVCMLLTTIMLSADHVYKSMFKFVECTSPKASNVSVQQCLQELPKNIFSGNL